MEVMKIGVMSQERIRERALAIARGEYKPSSDEPKVWFASMALVSEVLSDANRALLHTIVDAEPESISALAKALRQKRQVLLQRLEVFVVCGIIELKGEGDNLRPVVNTDKFKIIVSCE